MVVVRSLDWVVLFMFDFVLLMRQQCIMQTQQSSQGLHDFNPVMMNAT
jgi:hypothetical protein